MSNTVYDPDSDDKIIPGSHDDLGVHPEHREAEIDDLERQFEQPSAEEPQATAVNGTDTSEPPTGKQLKQQEEQPPDRSGFSSADMINEKLGKGYTGKDSQKSKFLSSLYSNDSRVKKRIAVAGAAAGGSAVIGVVVFLAMLPLKINSIVTSLESKYQATATSAVDSETQNAFSHYMTEKVLPNLSKKGCSGSTIDINCTVFASDTSTPMGRLYQSWKQTRLENKLATKYNLAFAYHNGSFYLNTDAASINLGHANGDGTLPSIFGDANTRPATRSEIRQAVRTGLQDATLYDRVFTRFKIGRLLEAKYGIRRCIIACNIRDKYTDKLTDKKNAAKAYLIQRTISPLSESYGIILQCLIGGGNTCDATPNSTSSTDGEGDQARTSRFQQNLQAQLDSFAERFGQDSLTQLLQDAQRVSGTPGGFQKYVIARVMSKALGTEVTTETINHIANPISWIQDVAKVVGYVDDAGKLKALGYAANSAAAVSLYMSYRTVADEAKSGHMDSAELGSFTDQLGDGVKDSNGNTSDATDAPLYASIMGSTTSTSGNSASIFGSMFGSLASADSTSSVYKCDNNKPVPTGQQACSEENLSQGNKTVSDFVNAAHGISGWPILDKVASVVNTVGNSSWNPLNWLSNLTSKLAGLIPGVNQLSDVVAGLTAPLFKLVMSALIPSPFSDSMSGGRTFDMIGAGADVAAQQTCQIQLGCAKVSDQAAAKIQTQYIAQQKAEFDSQPIFARMFSTNSSYSLISKLAVAMPTNRTVALDNGFSAVFTSPIKTFGAAFSSIFSVNSAFAQTPGPDPFGVTQRAYTSVPDNPDQYWKENCADPNNPLQIDPAKMTAWLDSQTVNPDTGEAEATQSFPCLLIQSIGQIGNASADPSLLPQGATDDANSTTDTTPTTNPTGDPKSLAAQVLTLVQQGKISFEVDSDKQNMVDTSQGKPISCTDRNGTVSLPQGISPDLSKFMIKLASKYSYRVSAMYSGHGGIDSDGCSDGGRHPMGRAIDVDQVNGQAVNYGANQSLVRAFAQFALTLLPNKGGLVAGQPVGIGGIGQEQCFSPPLSYPSGINHFDDLCTHLHLDVGANGIKSANGTNLQL